MAVGIPKSTEELNTVVRRCLIVPAYVFENHRAPGTIEFYQPSGGFRTVRVTKAKEVDIGKSEKVHISSIWTATIRVHIIPLYYEIVWLGVWPNAESHIAQKTPAAQINLRSDTVGVFGWSCNDDSFL